MPVAALVAVMGFTLFAAAVGISGWLAQKTWVVPMLARIVLGQVTMAHGTCPLGVGLGEVVRFQPNGTTSPALCAPAQAALMPFADATRRGVPIADTPCCPIWEHLLAFRFTVEPLSQAA